MVIRLSFSSTTTTTTIHERHRRRTEPILRLLRDHERGISIVPSIADDQRLFVVREHSSGRGHIDAILLTLRIPRDDRDYYHDGTAAEANCDADADADAGTVEIDDGRDGGRCRGRD
jgi:hypothetical protein